MSDNNTLNERVFSVRELADWSGLSIAFWRREINGGRLRALQLGAATRVLERDLESYLAASGKDGPCPTRDPRRNGRKPSGRPPRAGR